MCRFSEGKFFEIDSIASIMRPKDLKNPFSFKERKILFQDRVWHVPPLLENYAAYHFAGFDSADFFDNTHPIYVEYCSGNGAWIVEKAYQNPHINWVAVEYKFKRVRKIWSKMRNSALKNLLIICGEAFLVTAKYFQEKSIDKIFINFPDPWPKKKHHKHRLITAEFIDESVRTLKNAGIMTITTDDPPYSHVIEKNASFHPSLISLHQERGITTALPGYGTSYFEKLWRSQGKTIYYHQYKKI